MNPYLADPDVTLYQGDALEVLRGLPDGSVDCVATSPPFFGLRDYGVDGQIGLEPTPDEWAAKLVEVFREARRVLVKRGTLWVECGDSYAGSSKGGAVSEEAWQRLQGDSTVPVHAGGTRPVVPRLQPGALKTPAGLKPKDLIGSPFLLAFALRADGWWWRSMNIWMKPNCLPESATDRPTVQHSYVMQFSKAARYFHDAEAVREPAEWARWGDQTIVKEQPGKAGWIQPKAKPELRSGRVGRYQERAMYGEGDGTTPRKHLEEPNGQRNLRSVWTIPTQGYPDAHFATWPEALARRILLMACPEGGTVLDPFGGSGTTALVARKMGRRAVLIELSEDYCDLASRRLQQLSLLAAASSAQGAA